jgi:hypothetical protein
LISTTVSPTGCHFEAVWDRKLPLGLFSLFFKKGIEKIKQIRPKVVTYFKLFENDRQMKIRYPPALKSRIYAGWIDESRIHLSSGMNPGYILDKFGMLDKSGI